MKTVTTVHTEIGYTNNVAIIERALREQLGIDDQSHVMTSLAAHVWSCLVTGSDRADGFATETGYTFTSHLVKACIQRVRARVDQMEQQLTAIG